MLVEDCDIGLGEYILTFSQSAKAMYKEGRITFAAPAGLSVLSLSKGKYGVQRGFRPFGFNR